MLTKLVKDITKQWYIIDATGLTLGRMCSHISVLLMGKHRSYYIPYMDVGDFVIVVNANKVFLSGKKKRDKYIYRHSLYHGGLKKTNYYDQLCLYPENILRKSVAGMLPKTRLGRQMINKLKIYKGNEHPHSAQKPIVYDIES